MRMPDIVIHVVAARRSTPALALHFWSTRWRARDRRAPRAGGLRAWERAAILAAARAARLAALRTSCSRASELRFGFGQALSVMLWLAVLLYWVESLFYDLDGMQPLVLAARRARACRCRRCFPGRVGGAYAGSLEFRAAPRCSRCSPTACSPSRCCTRC